MPELSEDYIEGYTKAKKEDEDKVNKTLAALHKCEQDYIILKEKSEKDAAFIQANAEYLELGKAIATILKYLKGDKDV